MTKKILLITLLLLTTGFFAQKTYKHIALINATAHIGNGKVIETSLVVINTDKLEVVSDIKGIKLSYAAYDTVIDLSGKHIYPALINTNNILGLHDAESVRATRDFAEVGSLNPHVRALIAYNTDNKIVPTVKTNGVLYTQCTPRGGLISGSSSVMALEGWNWEDAVLKADDGIHINFPRIIERKYNEEGESTLNPNKKYNDEISLLTKFFSDAQSYCNTTITTEKNIRFEAMRSVLAGNANLYFHCDKAKDIISVINFSIKQNIKKPVIVGGKESYKVTAELKKNKVPVMFNRLFDLPDNPDYNVDIVYSTPYLLQKDSILFCLQLEGDMEAMHSRNLPFQAGATVAYGLSKEQALQSITLNVAKILGIDHKLGSLEEGKLASLIVSEGDILDIRSNIIISAYIAGKPVTLTNHQTDLYIKYKNKYGIK
ncbi:MAG: amidohydrolase family protein [Bacteroidetes bacterium]|nr:amidohydrolase family protein [Bacteroidota bacterium]